MLCVVEGCEKLWDKVGMVLPFLRYVYDIMEILTVGKNLKVTTVIRIKIFF